MVDVEKLKQKILDLAIRGKLVPQDPNDEPASVLIEKIKAEKAKLIKEGKIKASKEESYIYKGSDNFYYEKKGNKTVCIQDEVPFDIPDNWSFTRLNQILDVRDGTHDSPQYLENGVPFVTSKCLKENGIDFSQCKYISKSDADSFNKRSFVDDKDILFAMIGTIGNATIVNKNRDFAIKNVALFKNIKRDLLSEEWIKVLLDSFSLKMKEKTSSGLQPFVSLDFLRNYLVPIPPAEEQKRILSLLREVFLKVGIIQSDLNQIEVVCKKIKDKILELYFGENSSYKSYYPNNYLLGEILEYEQPGPYIVSSTDYNDEYKTPVLTPGKTFILGYTNEKEGIYHVDSKVIIFDDFTTASRLVNFDFKVKSSAMKILHSVDENKFNIDYMYYLLQTINVISDTHKRFWISEYASKRICIHTYEEQLKIVDIIHSSFGLLDSIIQ